MQKADGEKDKSGKEKLSAAAETETIESIMNFIQDESGSANDKEKGEKEKGSAADKEKNKDGEASVEQIFGKDAPAGAAAEKKQKKKSVYDLEPDGDDFSGKCSYTAFRFLSQEQLQCFFVLFSGIPTSTPKLSGPSAARGRGGRGGKSAAVKGEEVTRMGSNTYFYTGPRAKREEGGGGGEEEGEDGGRDEEDEFVGVDPADGGEEEGEGDLEEDIAEETPSEADSTLDASGKKKRGLTYSEVCLNRVFSSLAPESFELVHSSYVREHND